ncbi:MAG: response regulator transcription factor [Verrucomicrobia bacterium]|nr:response regulator transcription factor [Verrucomicrobiota bacterium]
MAPPNSIRVLLVDDHSVVRMGLAAVLSLDEDLTVVAEAEDGTQALEKYQAERPDVVLMDVRMPGLGGLEALRALLAASPGARVLMLTTSELDDDIQRAIDAGARGYLQKSVSREELVRAIHQVHAGGSYIPEATRRRLLQLAKRKHLSNREGEVLDGMRRGLSNRDIALTLSISEHTVKAHVKAILHKLESADRAEAVARGFEQGLLRVEGR